MTMTPSVSVTCTCPWPYLYLWPVHELTSPVSATYTWPGLILDFLPVHELDLTCMWPVHDHDLICIYDLYMLDLTCICDLYVTLTSSSLRFCSAIRLSFILTASSRSVMWALIASWLRVRSSSVTFVTEIIHCQISYCYCSLPWYNTPTSRPRPLDQIKYQWIEYTTHCKTRKLHLQLSFAISVDEANPWKLKASKNVT